MSLLGKIFTVLIFVMSVAFCILAVATFATHKNWKQIATNPGGTPPGLKERLEDQQKVNQDLERELQNARTELAVEQAARRAAIAAALSKLKLLESDLDNLAAQLKEKDSALTAQTQAAQVAEDTLKATTDELKKLREDVRIVQQDRNEQFNRAVDLTDKLNQAQSTLVTLRERNDQLQDQYARLQKLAKDHGLDESMLVSLPKVDAQVLSVNETRGLVEISVGSDDGVKRGHVLQVYRGDQYLGQIIITEVEHDRAVGTIDKKMQRGRIRERDNVTSKLS